MYVVSFQNSVAAASNGLTLHMFAAALNGGRIEFPCTVLWDEIFYCPITSLARMVQYFRIPEIQWCFFGDWHQPQMEANWRGKIVRNGLFKNGQLSSFLPEDFVYLEDDLRSRCPVLKISEKGSGKLRNPNFRLSLKKGGDSSQPRPRTISPLF